MIEFAFLLSDDSVLEQIENGFACYGFEIVCPATSLRYVQLLNESGTFKLDLNSLYGQVIFSPKVFVLEDIAAYRSINFNPEFEDVIFDLQAGDYLAVCEDEVLHVDFGRLKFTALIKAVRMSHKSAMVYDFGLDGDTIVIAMGEKFFDLWSSMRAVTTFQPFLIMSVYKDCIVAALECIAHNEDCLDLAWARALSDMLDRKQLTVPDKPTFGQINEIAQKLLEDLGVKKVTLQ